MYCIWSSPVDRDTWESQGGGVPDQVESEDYTHVMPGIKVTAFTTEVNGTVKFSYESLGDSIKEITAKVLSVSENKMVGSTAPFDYGIKLTNPYGKSLIWIKLFCEHSNGLTESLMQPIDIKDLENESESSDDSQDVAPETTTETIESEPETIESETKTVTEATPDVDLTGDWSGTGEEKFFDDTYGLACTADWKLNVHIKQNVNKLIFKVNGKLSNAETNIPDYPCEQDYTSFNVSLDGTIDGSKVAVDDRVHGKLIGKYTSAGIKMEGKVSDDGGSLAYKVQLFPNFTPPKIGTEEDSQDDVTPETTTEPEPETTTEPTTETTTEATTETTTEATTETTTESTTETTTEATTGLKECMTLILEKKQSEAQSCIDKLDLSSCEKSVYNSLNAGKYAQITYDCRGQEIKFDRMQVTFGDGSKISVSQVYPGVIRATIDNGQAKFSIEPSDKNSETKFNFEIRTKSASLGVRGTEFIVDYDSSSNITTVLLLEGSIDATAGEKTVIFSGENKFIVGDSGIIQTEPFLISEWNDLSAEIESEESIDGLSVKERVPGWIKNNAKWWADGLIGESEFVSGIQFMVKEKIIDIPDLPEQASTTAKEAVPDWIKNNAGWWADGLIGEDDFVNGIKYLVEKGIIKV